MRPPEAEIPAGEARCLPHSKHCPQATHCARWLQPANAGRPLKDYTTEAMFLPGMCQWMLVATAHRKKPAQSAPRVHEAPQGLR